jgi:transcriptional regulator with XRE-family HTH domain
LLPVALDAEITFGGLLRQLRRRSGMTQGALAALVGFSIAQVSRLEQNERLPNLALLAEKFIPALDLQAEPRLVQRLLELAAAARGERPPAAIQLTRAVKVTIDEQLVEAANVLPSAPTALIGRERTLRALSKRLMEAPGRLVTLVGPPGVGKTRLALAVATHLQALFADGAHFIALATLTDPALAPSAILAALSLAESSAKAPAERLIEALRRKELLLVLDNFEQVNGAAPFVAHLLEQCAQLRILVTSREPLRLRAEQRFKLAPLEPAAAVELFLQRATAINPDFAPTSEQAAQIAEICLRLDCLPLAIELVAARSELFSPSELLAQLQHGRLTLLETGACDLPERQRTLRNAIDWSYRLLSGEAQQLFRALGVSRIDSPYFVSRCLAGLGSVALARAKAELAAQLLAAAYRLFDELPPFLAPADQTIYAQLVERTRLALGEVHFSVAWDIGTNLSSEAAIRLGASTITQTSICPSFTIRA